MKWVSKQFILPILIGFSLTGVSIAMIYLLYKKDDENADKLGESKLQTSKVYKVECRIPRQFVPAVIGRGGSVIKDIQNKTTTKIYFEDDNIENTERICVIRGTKEGVHLAEAMITTVIANQPIIETYEMYVPERACGRIIGRAGETIRQIQAASSAKIIMDSMQASYEPDSERRIIIKGTAEQIASALLQIEDKVREDNEARKKREVGLSTRMPRSKLSPRNTKSSISESTTETVEAAEQFTPMIQTVDGSMEVYVSAMENPNQFWVQVVGPGTTELDKLVFDMTAYYNEEENQEIHALKNITIGQMVAAKLSIDNQWYRAEVISVEDDQYEVYFVDYGDREVVNANSILELRTDFLSLRLQAIECSLANIKSRDGEWTNEACDRFAELTWLAQWKVLIAKVRGYKERVLSCGKSRREGSPIPCIELYNKRENKDINVAQELINEGVAASDEETWSAASSTISLSRRSHDVRTPTPASTPPSGKRALYPDTSTDAPQSTHSKVEEIDLTTPKRPTGPVEEIDLVTPIKDQTKSFIERERSMENGGGDHIRNGSANQYKSAYKTRTKTGEPSLPLPAGYESDLSGDSDELEMG